MHTWVHGPQHNSLFPDTKLAESAAEVIRHSRKHSDPGGPARLVVGDGVVPTFILT